VLGQHSTGFIDALGKEIRQRHDAGVRIGLKRVDGCTSTTTTASDDADANLVATERRGGRPNEWIRRGFLRVDRA